METFDSMRFNPIQLYHQLHMSSSNAKQTQKHVKYAWIELHDSENKMQTVTLFLMILWASMLGFDCKSLPTLPATCLNQYKALNWLGTQESVLTFLELVMAFSAEVSCVHD